MVMVSALPPPTLESLAACIRSVSEQHVKMAMHKSINKLKIHVN